MKSVLLIGTFPQLMNARREAFEAAGYRVFASRHVPGGIRAATRLGVDAVVVGHGFSDDERHRICEAIRRSSPTTCIVVLYLASVSGVELADAVLDVTGNVNDLVSTVDGLVQPPMTGRGCA
jgi:PleD family two-component response regulator